MFFENKRVIDIACGDSFSVIIAETYKITSKKQKNIFDKLRSRAGKDKQAKGNFTSQKMHIESTRLSICAQGGNTGNQIPESLRSKITSMLLRKAQKQQKRMAQSLSKSVSQK